MDDAAVNLEAAQTGRPVARAIGEGQQAGGQQFFHAVIDGDGLGLATGKKRPAIGGRQRQCQNDAHSQDEAEGNP